MQKLLGTDEFIAKMQHNLSSSHLQLCQRQATCCWDRHSPQPMPWHCRQERTLWQYQDLHQLSMEAISQDSSAIGSYQHQHKPSSVSRHCAKTTGCASTHSFQF